MGLGPTPGKKLYAHKGTVTFPIWKDFKVNRPGGATLKLFQFQKNLESENVQKRVKKDIYKILRLRRDFFPQKKSIFPITTYKKNEIILRLTFRGGTKP